MWSRPDAATRPSLLAGASSPGAVLRLAAVGEERALGLAVEVRHTRAAVEAVVARRLGPRHAAAARGGAARLARCGVDVLGTLREHPTAGRRLALLRLRGGDVGVPGLLPILELWENRGLRLQLQAF